MVLYQRISYNVLLWYDVWHMWYVFYTELRVFYRIVIDITVNIWWWIAAKIPHCMKWIGVCGYGCRAESSTVLLRQNYMQIMWYEQKRCDIACTLWVPLIGRCMQKWPGDIKKIYMPVAMARHIETQLKIGWNLFRMDLVETTSMNDNMLWCCQICHKYIHIYIRKNIDCIQRATWTEHSWLRTMWRMMDTLYIIDEDLYSSVAPHAYLFVNPS